MSESGCPLSALTGILWRSEMVGILSRWAKARSMRLPSAPESSNAERSCLPAAHCSLTGRRVVFEDWTSDTPPDSNLMSTAGLALLLGTRSGSAPTHHSTDTIL